MKSREAIRALTEVSRSQWGFVTASQAAARGVSRLELSRLTESGDLVRLAHGVYRDVGAPGDEFESLRATWLSTDPTRLAEVRIKERPNGPIVSGQSAAILHGIGEFNGDRHEFTVPTRRQTQRPDVHYRTRTIAHDEVTLRAGLPVTSVERTIADLVEARVDLGLIGHAFADAARGGRIDLELLTRMLAPLAERNGHRKGDGAALREYLLQIAGLDQATLAKEIAATPGLGDLVAASHVRSVPRIDTAQFERRIIASFADHGATLTEASTEIVGAIKQQFDDINAVIARQGPETRQSLVNQMKAINLHALTKVVRTHSPPRRPDDVSSS